MSYDAHKNLAYSTIATAPVPAASGTSLVVQTGDAAKFPAVSFNATIWPSGTNPTTANAEIVRVTNIAGDTFTITRLQESTSARTIIVGDQIAATITVKTFTDIEAGGIGIASQAANDVIFASSATQLGRSANLKWDGTAFSVNGPIAVAATKKVYFDGVAATGDTYIDEVSANVLRFTVGATDLLRLTSSDVYTTDWTDYSATSTIVGWSGTPTKHIWYKKIGKLVFVNFAIDGTSNAVTATFTLPFTAVNNGIEFSFSGGYTVDNGVARAAGAYCRIVKNTSIVDMYPSPLTANWTNVNNKAIYGQMWFQATT